MTVRNGRFFSFNTEKLNSLPRKEFAEKLAEILRDRKSLPTEVFKAKHRYFLCYDSGRGGKSDADLDASR